MKKIILVGAILSTVLASAQQGIGTNLPDKSSALELRSTKRGLLIPRVELEAINVASPITKPANSLLVFNTVTAGAGVNQVTEGYYYWDDVAKKWIRLVNDADLAVVATEAGTKSTETVSSADANIVEVTATGGALNKNYAVGIKPAGDTETKILKSTNGTVAWEDAPAAAAAATLNNITGTAKIVADIDVATWGNPGEVFLCVTTTTAAVDLPNPAQYAGKIIAVNNQANHNVGYITNAPQNRSSLFPGHGHLLMSVQMQGGGYGWYIIGGSY